MFLVALWSLWARFRNTLYTDRWLLRAAVLAGPSGFIAVIAGWVTTENGRQPWTVYGLLRTADSVSNIAAPAVGASLLAFIIVYFIVFGAGAFYILRLMSKPVAPSQVAELDKGQFAHPESIPARLKVSNPTRSLAMTFDLATIWAAVIAFAILAYVILDGFDLGIGILFAVFHHADDRNLMTNSVAPVWDGNETWFVLGGGGLLAVFPLAYATIRPALYAPLIAMLLGLVFRGVAFEFRWRTQR